MRIKRFAAVLGVVLLVIPILTFMTAYAYPGIEQNQTIIFDVTTNQRISIPSTYKLKKIIAIQDDDGQMASEPVDIFVAGDGRTYVLDMMSGRVFLYNSRFELTKIISSFFLENGEESPLNKPEGIFVTDDGIIYIADTQNERIIKINEDGRILFITNKPESFQGIAIETFYPIKVVTDSIGRLSVVARNINMGLLQFDVEGNFTGYTGAPKVKVNLLTKVWKIISTQEQKAQMEQFVPTEYSNICIDKDGFVYGCISSISQTDVMTAYTSKDKSGNATPIKKLNSMGKDVLKRNGTIAPLGNLDFLKTGSVSRMIDVALGPSGSYTMLDNLTGTLYTYSDEGILLYAFGGKGKSKNSFERPVAIDYLGDDILVLDSLISQIMVFEPTEYYKVVLDAISAEYTGDFDVAYDKWGEVTRQNSNFSYAYIGLGKAEYEKGNYQEAKEYFEYARETRMYSKAKEKQRQEYMATAFPIVFSLVLVMILSFFINGTILKIRRYFEERS